MGYLRAVSMMPDIAIMFDCAYVRKMDRFGRYFPPPNDFYIKPFGEKEIAQVKKNNKRKKFCRIENMAKPDGWTPTTMDKHNREKIMHPII